MNSNTQISLEEADQLIGQVQAAHRLAAGFYSRLLVLLDEMAQQLALQFWYWSSEEDIKVPKGGTQARYRPVWDFLPLFVSSHCYSRLGEKGTTLNDVGLAFVVYVDDSYDADGEARQVKRGVPDPVELPIGRAVLRTYLYRATEASPRSFYELWDKCPWVETSEAWVDVTGVGMKGLGREWKLRDVIVNPQDVVTFLRPLCE